MNSTELSYLDETTAFLIAGRILDAQFRDGGFTELCDSLEELAAELGEPLVVVAAGAFAFEGDIVASGAVSCALGLLIGSTDTEDVAAFSHQDLVSGVARARALPWDRIDALVAAAADEQPREPDGGIGLYATACGPLAGVLVGYGVPVAVEDPEVVDGLEVVRAALMDQGEQPTGVYGLEVGRGLSGDVLPIRIDVAEPAHADRVNALGALSAQSSYHLIANYD